MLHNTTTTFTVRAQGVKIIPALQAVAVGLAIRFLAPIPAGITKQVCVNEVQRHAAAKLSKAAMAGLGI
jgi:hypothetical protein